MTGVGSSGRTERDDGRPECESTQGTNGRKAQGRRRRRRRRRRRGGAGGCAQLMCKHKGGRGGEGGKEQPAKSRRSLVNTVWLDLLHWLSNFR